MASVYYPNILTQAFSGNLDLVNDTIKVMLVMSNTTVDTETSKDVVGGGSGFTTLDEFDGSGYTGGFGGAGRKTLSNKSVSDDGTTFTFDNTVDPTWTALGAGSRQIDGALIFRAGSADDTDAVPIAFLDATNLTTNGSDVTLNLSASGILSFT